MCLFRVISPTNTIKTFFEVKAVHIPSFMIGLLAKKSTDKKKKTKNKVNYIYRLA